MKTNILLLVVIALILLSVGSTMSVQSDVDTTLPGGVDSDDNLILYTSEQSSEEETTPVEVVEEEPEEEQEETETEEKVATVATTSGGSSGGGSSGSSSAVSSTVTSTEQAIACSCGDGTVDSGEECDDGNLIDGDGCSANCDLEVPDCVDADLEFDVDLMVIGIDCLDGWDKPQDQVAIDIPVGARYEVEGQAWRGHPGQCQTNEDFFMEINGDIGYETNDDADSCKISVRMDPLGTFDFNTGLNDVIMHTAAQCPPDVHPNSVEVKKLCLFYVEECGNGILDPDEDCDDGNDVDDDECRNDCTAPFCGDGILDPSEDCDDGNNVDGDGCSALCLNEVCGDGVLQPDEECEFDSDCDDSDEYTSDSCVDCSCAYERIPFCGDWVLDPGEECDNGPNNSDIVPDACREDCSLPFCGDFVVESWEECDDGNDVSGDGCQANCMLPFCGDWVLDPGEECDDGNLIDDDGCRNDCSYCGDGNIDPSEECDDGNDVDDDECRNDCTLPYCGDGMLDPGEQCDDGNNDNFDGCNEDCLDEVCGDGVLQPDEECDDGVNNGVPCEPPYSGSCTYCSELCEETTLWDGYCGDGILQPDYEECDDGNNEIGDGCQADCMLPFCGDWVLDPGEECDNGPNNSDIVPDACREDCSLPFCGDFVVESWEECDDGNDVSGDGCQANCMLPFCGDWVLDPGEECDDGNLIDDDGCRNDCTFCGDGNIDPSEECDDGNNDNFDGCNSECLDEYCGDGILQPDEECDDGNDEDNDGCSSDCNDEFCGDGVIQPPEECDDGNIINDDGCTEFCVEEFCGDGVLQSDEECDDGNNDNFDGCNSDCNDEFCGDGVLQPDEECDDGNQIDDDDCSNDCETNECELILYKTDSVDPVQPGDELTYYLVLENIGTTDCTGTGVRIKDVFDENTDYVSSTETPEEITSDYIKWNVGTLHPGDQAVVDLIMLVSEETECGSILVNKAKYWSDQTGWGDYVIEETEVICPEPGMKDAKVAQPQPDFNMGLGAYIKTNPKEAGVSRTYFHFDLSDHDSDPISSATLNLAVFYTGANVVGSQIQAWYCPDHDFVEADINWNNQPFDSECTLADIFTVPNTVAAGIPETWHSYDLTYEINEELTNLDQEFTVVLISALEYSGIPDNSYYVQCVSKDYSDADYRPRLDIT